MLLTVMTVPALVVAFPTLSLAIAESLCAPLVADVVFQEVEYGPATIKLPKLPPSSWNCTLATPTLSVALATTVMLPETVVPLPGEVIETTGGVVSPPEEAVVNVRSLLTAGLLLASEEWTR